MEYPFIYNVDATLKSAKNFYENCRTYFLISQKYSVKEIKNSEIASTDFKDIVFVKDDAVNVVLYIMYILDVMDNRALVTPTQREYFYYSFLLGYDGKRIVESFSYINTGRVKKEIIELFAFTIMGLQVYQYDEDEDMNEMINGGEEMKLKLKNTYEKNSEADASFDKSLTEMKKSKATLKLDVMDIKLNNMNEFLDSDESIEEFANQIYHEPNGVLESIVVYKDSNNDYVLLSGHRRVKACRYLLENQDKLDGTGTVQQTISAVVLEQPVSKEDELRLILSYNTYRRFETTEEKYALFLLWYQYYAILYVKGVLKGKLRELISGSSGLGLRIVSDFIMKIELESYNSFCKFLDESLNSENEEYRNKIKRLFNERNQEEMFKECAKYFDVKVETLTMAVKKGSESKKLKEELERQQASENDIEQSSGSEELEEVIGKLQEKFSGCSFKVKEKNGKYNFQLSFTDMNESKKFFNEANFDEVNIKVNFTLDSLEDAFFSDTTENLDLEELPN